VFLLPDLTPHTNSQKDVTDDVLVYADPSTTVDDSFEFEGQELEGPDELAMSIPSAIEHRDKLDDIS